MQSLPKASRRPQTLRGGLLAAAVLTLALGPLGCATDDAARTSDADDDETSGPTVYGQVGVSVDSVTVRNARVR